MPFSSAELFIYFPLSRKGSREGNFILSNKSLTLGSWPKLCSESPSAALVISFSRNTNSPFLSSYALSATQPSFPVRPDGCKRGPDRLPAHNFAGASRAIGQGSSQQLPSFLPMLLQHLDQPTRWGNLRAKGLLLAARWLLHSRHFPTEPHPSTSRHRRRQAQFPSSCVPAQTLPLPDRQRNRSNPHSC